MINHNQEGKHQKIKTMKKHPCHPLLQRELLLMEVPPVGQQIEKEIKREETEEREKERGGRGKATPLKEMEQMRMTKIKRERNKRQRGRKKERDVREKKKKKKRDRGETLKRKLTRRKVYLLLYYLKDKCKHLL